MKPTCHQLLGMDSTANGMVAWNSSFPDRIRAFGVGESLSDSNTCPSKMHTCGKKQAPSLYKTPHEINYGRHHPGFACRNQPKAGISVFFLRAP